MSALMKLREKRQLSTLCFDIENKPGTYGPGDFTHGKVTAIAAQFVGGPGPAGWILDRRDPGQMRKCMEQFVGMWEAADRVMGHNIKAHDVALLNGGLAMLDMPLLPKRRMVDTYRDAAKTRGFSRSLENQCDRWGCPEKKVHMSEFDWEQAWDGVPGKVEKMRQRCMSDVRLNIWLFHELRRRGLL